MSKLFRCASTAVLAALAGCETTPSTGAAATAQVIAVPRTRAELGGGYADLHPAVRAGVGRTAAERGRLVRGECGEPDPTARGGVRWRVVTTVLPEGMAAHSGTYLELADHDAPPGAAGRQHGRFLALTPAPAPADAVPSGLGDRLQTRCRPAGLAQGRLRIRLLGAVSASDFDFAQAELRRHDGFSDAELSEGRVVMVACQLKVVDGGDWYAPAWLARGPDGLPLRVGQVVKLRAGAAEHSRDVTPVAQVLSVEPAEAPARGTVRCR